jgi:DNA-binding NtrC family response regulator
VNRSSSKKALLIIDDDKLLCDAVREYFSRNGIEAFTAGTGSEGLSICARVKVDVVLLGRNLPDTEGHTLCPSILKYNEQSKIIFITAHPGFDGAIKAIRAGAHDYLSKPFEPEELLPAVRRALTMLALERAAQVEDYKSRKESEDAVLVGSSDAIVEIRRLVGLAASADAPVLITGEIGAGKNAVAKAVHYTSSARRDAFISINCAALPENLIEAELFGYEKGAFAGTSPSKRGIFEMAEGGTLLLDEIGEMPLPLQSKLLSVLEEKKIKRLGGDVIRPVEVRVVAATGADLENMLGRTFRSDLYYRLSVITIHIPPLRERREDIPELCEHLLGKVANGRLVRLEDGELKRLMGYDWPGNIRELKNILERAVILRRGTVVRPSELLGNPAAVKAAVPAAGSGVEDAIVPLSRMEQIHIEHALDKLSGNYTRTAKALGISLSTLKRKLREYDLNKSRRHLF